jgi:hypothetical protein
MSNTVSVDVYMKNLFNQVQNIIDEVSETKVKPLIIKTLQEHAKTDFYNSYTPAMYQRTYSLYEDTSYKVTKISHGFAISSNDFHNDEYGKKDMFALAEAGSEYGLWDRYPADYSNMYDKYNRDSHFISKAVKELNKGMVANLMKSELKKKGLNVR